MGAEEKLFSLDILFLRVRRILDIFPLEWGEIMAKQKRPGDGLHGCLVSLVWIMGILLALGIGGIVYVNGSPEAPETSAVQNSGDDGDILSKVLGWAEDMIGRFSDKDSIINILLIGQDQRPGEDHKISDTMIICSINKKTRAVTLCSLMRDMYVKLPDYKTHTCGMNRINAAYSLGYNWDGTEGAMAMLDQLILEQFGVTVDYNVEIGFDAFQRVVDYVGGVDIPLTAAEAAYLTNHSELSGVYQEGEACLNGQEALAYARMRHSSAADSDFYRTGRQRTVVSAMLVKCRDLNPLRLAGMVRELLPLVETDMSSGQILSLGISLLPVLKNPEIKTQQIPADGTYTNQTVEISGYPAAVLVPDLEKNREILMSICEPGN